MVSPQKTTQRLAFSFSYSDHQEIQALHLLATRLLWSYEVEVQYMNA